VGFYVKSAEADEMVLGPRRDKPACSPIGMYGACGRCWREGRALVIRDVRDLGEGYIACDPRDQSEIVLPVRDSAGLVWGVLDLDSFEVGAFDETDTVGLGAVLEAAFSTGS
jgi:putative methionine-R-sulfoxide reductase with GAF domain